MFYLDIGGSASLGVQPTLSNPHGQRTDHGYANDLVVTEALHGVTLEMTQTGCPGETTETMLFAGDSCPVHPGSQLSRDVAFLLAHRGEPGVVTVDLGFNNLLGCFHQPVITAACINPKMSQLSAQVPVIMAQLHSAADQNVIFIGVGHYDPFLANRRNATIARALTGLGVVNRLNRTLAAAYALSATPLANVARAFSMNNVTPVARAGWATVPKNVARACALTWMCRRSEPPNMHPDAAGYHRIARAISAVLTGQLTLHERPTTS